eukprot:TRINITY_DN8587_c0_g1_i1.p1 TRINITY_DN8587_c0_g1~~TRINITY_DN8587_c0_g1_i1.p1  ORF type:complete len:618 (-),score=188.31 TRINITY_DN8587_c0_g1_i1:202-1953(-)
MGYQDERRFPDWSYISKSGKFTELIDCIIISHFHLDHCGSLPYFTEMMGYDGPIYMTYPTKAICPILLEDYRKITVEKKGDANFFTSQMIKNCMKKVIAVNIHQTIYVDDDLEIKAYYAGHVLGAAMFYVKSGGESVVYTGDYNMTPDRHLGGAWMDKIEPDLLITETTYATTIRDSKRTRERDFLKRVHSCVEKGGKVLIPVFALGRAQELCILLDSYWERMGLGHIPIYFSAGLVEKANLYYKLFINWTNQKIKKTFVHRNMFDFKHIKPWDRNMVDAPGPMVLFATPGMLHAGTSLEVFKKWAPNELNMCILPGYCVVGTVGNKLLAGHKGVVEIDKKTSVEVKCQVHNLSFSAHADVKGILQLIRQSQPKNVLLVHGEKGKMHFLKEKIIEKFDIGCFDPPNGTTIFISTSHRVPVDISTGVFKRQLAEIKFSEEDLNADRPLKHLREALTTKTPIQGVLLMNANQEIFKLVDPQEAAEELGLPEHSLKFTTTWEFPQGNLTSPADVLNRLYKDIAEWLEDQSVVLSRDVRSILIRSLNISLKENSGISLSWDYEDEELVSHVLAIVRKSLNGDPQNAK